MGFIFVKETKMFNFKTFHPNCQSKFFIALGVLDEIDSNEKMDELKASFTIKSQTLNYDDFSQLFSINPYLNGREKGYIFSINAFGFMKNPTFAFSEQRNSDSIVVYTNLVNVMEHIAKEGKITNEEVEKLTLKVAPDTGYPFEDDDEKSYYGAKTFSFGDYDGAATYIIETLITLFKAVDKVS
jgi:hypothetical protein